MFESTFSSTARSHIITLVNDYRSYYHEKISKNNHKNELVKSTTNYDVTISKSNGLSIIIVSWFLLFFIGIPIALVSYYVNFQPAIFRVLLICFSVVSVFSSFLLTIKYVKLIMERKYDHIKTEFSLIILSLQESETQLQTIETKIHYNGKEIFDIANYDTVKQIKNENIRYRKRYYEFIPNKETHEIKIEIYSDIIHIDIKDIFYGNIWKLEKIFTINIFLKSNLIDG